jgi:hypothetical protein
MASVNKVILIGNLGRDPEVRYLPDGDPMRSICQTTGRDHCPALSISDDMPEAGGGGESAAAPEVAGDDDDDGGDDDGEPARSRPHSKPSNPPAPGSASKKHHGLDRSRTRHPAEKPLEIKTIAVGEFELAESIGMSVEFLRKDRSGKRLIPFYRIGTAIRYNPTRVGEALSALEVGGYAPKPKATKARQSNLTAG